MRRFQALLLMASLAAPTSALAGPKSRIEDRSPTEDRSVEVFEWSMGRGRLGLMLMSLTPQLRTHFGSTTTDGVLVGQVQPGSPAAKAGVRVGDVLTRANSQPVDGADDVRAAISGAKKGDAVELTVVRDRKPLSINVKLESDAAAPVPSIESFFSRDWLRDLMKPFEGARESPKT